MQSRLVQILSRVIAVALVFMAGKVGVEINSEDPGLNSVTQALGVGVASLVFFVIDLMIHRKREKARQ